MSLICDMFNVSIRLFSFKSTNSSMAAITLCIRYVYINVFLCIKPSPASKSVWPSLDIIPCSTTTNETVYSRAWKSFLAFSCRIRRIAQAATGLMSPSDDTGTMKGA